MSVNSPRTRMLATMPTGTEVAAYRNYEDAVRAVEKLGQGDFPLNAVTIAGSDLHTSEQVMGRLTAARVALSGGTQGLTWGLLMGFISLVMVPQAGPFVALVAIAIGVLAGVLMAVIMWAANPNKRSFYARSSLVAARYAILVTEQADKAHSLLAGTEGKLAPGSGHPVRHHQTQVARPAPRTYSQAQSAQAEDSGRSSGEGANVRVPRNDPSEPPKFGVRLGDVPGSNDPDAKRPSDQDEGGQG